jgi:DNA recombination protein RmuC
VTIGPVPEWISAALLALNVLLLLWLAWRASQPADPGRARDVERLERELRDELGRQGQTTRADLANFQRLLLAQAELRQAVETRLAALQEGNEKKLEQMRATVDEKLHATLEQRLGESFKQVADRLEQVHKGLGEMQTLARDVGSLNRVLTNVKTRGIYRRGAARPACWSRCSRPSSTPPTWRPCRAAARGWNSPSACRAAVADGRRPLWLPIDAKFPREDYERLLDAQERADAAGRGGRQGHRDATSR